jgi:hypothetical protein
MKPPLLVVVLAIVLGAVTGAGSVGSVQASPITIDYAQPEGPASVAIGASEGSWYRGTTAEWYMYATDDPSADLPGVTTLPYGVPEYHWWNGCSPTAAGMLFACWDTHMGKELYDGDSASWDKVNMDMSNPAHYADEHNMVASWDHYQAGQDKGLTYGSWDRNGNGVVDASDQAAWNCLADFMRTEDGGTSRSNMAQGFIDYAFWNDPSTPAFESYYASATTDWSATWAEYGSEIDTGYPVHVGITGHSILGFGYWTGMTPWHTEPTDFVVNWTTWGGGWDGLWGLVEFDEVYAFTTLRVGQPTPEPATCVLALLGLGFGGALRAQASPGAVGATHTEGIRCV